MNKVRNDANLLTLFEHDIQAVDWTKREFDALGRINRAAGADLLRPVLFQGQLALQATQYVGVVRLAQRTIQILPKMHRNAADPAECAREATQNLLHLLAYAGEVAIHELAVTDLSRQTSDWFEILTYLFASNLAEEWQRGAYRAYQSFDAELPVLRGKWRVSDQLRRVERKHIFAVNYDEFTADNVLNCIFRHVVERLWGLTGDVRNRQLLDTLRQWMDEVTLMPGLRASDASPSILTRLNRRYEPLLNLAKLFLNGGALQLVAGDQSIFAFVFDMNKLFEAFIVNFIRRHRSAILPSSLQAAELLPQSSGATLYLASHESKPVFQLKPDLAVRNGREFPILLDTKYKPLSFADLTLGISQADFYQMHAYARRYLSPRVVLIYPQTADMPASLFRSFVLNGSDATKVIAVTVDLRGQLRRPDEREKLVTRLKVVLAGEEEV